MFPLLCDAQAGTPGCTKEACKFRDEYGKFVDAECEVFGISSDSTEANAAFAKKERLPFPLLTDQSDFLRKSFGIKGNVFGMLKGRQVNSIVCAVAHSVYSSRHLPAPNSASLPDHPVQACQCPTTPYIATIT